jgi:hypothetical protein
MKYTSNIAAGIVCLLLNGCADTGVLTMEEVEKQNNADSVVSSVLFENALDTSASYNVRKNGYVIIKFDESVPGSKYTEVVGVLRSNPMIKGVRAEQGGVEVCPLK